MIRVHLLPEQGEILEQARRIRRSHLVERCLAVLLSDRGQSVPIIAESIGRHDHTIRSWLKAYLREGLGGLKNTPPPGRTHRKAHEALAILQPVLAKHPSEYGYLEAGGSTSSLVDYLSTQGLEVSASTVKRALKQGGWVYKRFAKTMPAHAPSSEEKKVGWMRSSRTLWRGARRKMSPCCSSMNRILATSPMCTEAGSGSRSSRK